MQEYERIDLQLQEVGQMSESINAIIRNGNDNWDIYLVGDVEINLAHDQIGETLYLTAEIGKLNSYNKLQIFRTLLQFNLLADHTGGVVVGLDDEDCAHLSAELDVAIADQSTLRAIIENCAVRVLIWRSVINSKTTGQLTEVDDASGNQSGLRV